MSSFPSSEGLALGEKQPPTRRPRRPRHAAPPPSHLHRQGHQTFRSVMGKGFQWWYGFCEWERTGEESALLRGSIVCYNPPTTARRLIYVFKVASVGRNCARRQACSTVRFFGCVSIVVCGSASVKIISESSEKHSSRSSSKI